MKYDELGYSLPNVSAQQAAGQAIAVLEAVAKVDTGCLFYLMQASNVLALANLRAHSPYNDFAPSFPAERRALLAKLLHMHSYEIISEGETEGAPHTFLLLSAAAFEALPERYSILRPYWKEPRSLGNLPDFINWSDRCEASFKALMNKKELPHDWLQSKWAAHNLRFGMLLGYPGPAISSVCWDEVEHIEGEGSTLVTSRGSTPFQGAYCGTEVRYGYEPALRKDKILLAHQALWADVLTQVYAVFSPSRVAKLPDFAMAYKAYRTYDKASSGA